MRRAICLAEPHVVVAGQVGTWRFNYTPAQALPKGTNLKFNIGTQKREMDWEVPNASLRQSSNTIYLQLEGNKVVEGKEVEVPDSSVPQFEFTLPSEVKAGHPVTIVMGASPKAKGPDGNRAQKVAQRRRTFLLYIDPTGKRNYAEPEQFTVDVRGGPLHVLKALCPAYVFKNKRFDVTVRFEDQFGNLTNVAPENTLISLSYENLRENLSWKLFVPETGFVTLPNLYFNEEGIYRLQLENLATKETFHSAPIKCFAASGKQLFWGLLHGESERYDSGAQIESCLRHCRSDLAFSFYGTSPFESEEETPAEIWKQVSRTVAEMNEGDRFVTFLGCQWEGDPGKEGIRQLVYLKDERPLPRREDAKYSNLSKIYRLFSPKELLSIPSFSMGKGHGFHFDPVYSEWERVVEIYNAWGSSECTAKEGNPFPIRAGTKKGVAEDPKGSILEALREGHRFGFVAGGLDDRGCYANLFEENQEQYAPGLTAIMATALSRDSVMEALYNRSCYATTGSPILVGLSVAGSPMGSELTMETKPGLGVNRYIEGYAAGTAPLDRIELIRNGEVLKTFEPTDDQPNIIEFAHDDMEPLAQVALKGSNGKPPFVFYYLRVYQSDGHMAWGSPIWIDVAAKGASKAAAPVKAKAKK
jgi:hypothetical protein